MLVRKALITAALAAAALVATPQKASADWYLTPFIGGVFGGRANFGEFNNFEDEFEKRVNFGAAIGWMGAGVIGLEADFSWTPNYFENTIGDSNFAFGDSNVTTFMGNLIIGVPIGGQTGPGFRPYASGGVGLIRSHADGSDFFNDLSTDDFGFNVGGGFHAFFTDNVGIRGDIRYFRSLQDNEPDDEFDVALADFSFWRGSVGVTFRFGN
jgi:opacity protein-like surface antigen